MIRRRKPLPRNSKPLKRTALKRSTKRVRPVSKKANATRIVEDSRSPDGRRFVMNREDWSEERYRTAQIAGFMCEGCKKSHPVPFSEHGQAHHRLGRGGGRRDDRALVPMQTLESEPNLARWRWFRNTQWTCQIGHELLEKKSTKEYRHSLMKFCECGLLSVDKL